MRNQSANKQTRHIIVPFKNLNYMGFNPDKPADTLSTFNLTLVLFDGDCAAL